MPDNQLTPLASAADFLGYGSFATLIRDFADGALDRMMLRATRAIESRCDRRLAPFTITESCRADGVDLNGPETAGWPLDLIAALGKSKAQAFGTGSSMVRDVWLSEYAPIYGDLWTYSGVSVVLARSYGDTQDIAGASLEGPEPDTGHLRLRFGTFTPVGTTVRVTYSGGYTTVPEDLNTATVLQAAKFAIMAAEPQSRKGFTLEPLDEQILDLCAPFIRC
jgi:hypothetical protein